MWNEVVRWWKDHTGPGRLALISLVVLLVSQFFTYYTPFHSGYLAIHADFSTTGYYRFDAQEGGTGWKLHRWGWPVLLLLFALHGTDIADSQAFRRFGFWLSIPLMFFALSPGSIETPGLKLGLVAWALMFIAAVWNHLQRRRARLVPPPPPVPPSGD